MPEETILRCDKPDCSEVGEYCTIIIAGKACDVILCPDHRAIVEEVAKWGRPSRPRATPRRRRDMSTARLERMFEPDDPET